MTPHPLPAITHRLRLGLPALAALLALATQAADERPASAAAKPALSVTLAQPQRSQLPLTLVANGNIAAWQEASVGTEANGLRLAEVLVNVGDRVKKGQVLATFSADTVLADGAQVKAALAEAEAHLAEARSNARRARDLQPSGALSEQQLTQYLTAETTAVARLDLQRALARQQQLRLGQTRVLAPDSGVVSARSATVGAVLPAGQELFRLIRQGRLEWRAELPSADLAALRPGGPVRVQPASGGAIAGRVRQVAPTVDPLTRNGLVYVDLPAPGGARAGMFAQGEFEVGSSAALTLPQAAVLLRDGFAYVFRLGPQARVSQVKVAIGRRVGDRIEITGGLAADAQVVAAGGGFLADGDTVRVVDPAAPAAAAGPSPAAPARARP